jgi:cytoskeletal protein RodZ
MKESTEKTEPKVKPKDSKLKEFFKENSKIVLGVIIGVLIMTAGIAVAAGVTTSNKSKKSSIQQETTNNSDKKSSDNVKQQNTDASQAPSSGGTSTNGGSTSSSNSSNATPVAPSPPPAPSSVNYTFFAGTYTPQPFPNYPNDGSTGAGNMSGALNAQGYVNLRLSWNKTADIQLRVQGSNNGTSWVDYYNYNTSSGSITVAVNAAYYRVFAYIGNCLGGSPCVDPVFNAPYNLNFSGLLTK